MRGLGCCYTKKDIDPAHFAGARRKTAIANAELLERMHGTEREIRERDPWTDVHLLVRALMRHA